MRGGARPGTGGKREGSGRPKQDVIRKLRAGKFFDDEWEIVKEFSRQLKKGVISKEKARAWLAANVENN